MQSEKPSPQRAGRAGMWIVAVIAAVIIVIFVGRTIRHSEASDRSSPAQVDPQDTSYSPHDLTVEPKQAQ